MKFVRTPVKAVLAGGSSDAKRYEALVRKHGVEGSVSMRGFVSDDELVNLYANALGVCYLPFDEDYGYVTLESMLSEKPVIVSSDSGGAAELVEHQYDGLVVEPNPHDIAVALDELYLDRENAARMGSRGREKLQGMELSWERVVQKIISASE
jgi:glycosyltransferase involved in cell wall biosynthesis